jgi:hypothetical protein
MAYLASPISGQAVLFCAPVYIHWDRGSNPAKNKDIRPHLSVNLINPLKPTPTQDIYCVDKPRNAARHDADKPTPSVATPIVATPTKDSKNIVLASGSPTTHYRTDAARRNTYRRDADFNSKSSQGAWRRHTTRYSETDSKRRDADKIFHTKRTCA